MLLNVLFAKWQAGCDIPRESLVLSLAVAFVLVAIPATATAGCQASGAPDSAVAAADTASGPGAPLSGLEDEGSFSLYKNEEKIVSGSFAWMKDGSYEGEYTLSMANQSVTTEMTIEVDGTGHWTKMAMMTPLGPVSIVRQDGVAEIASASDTSSVLLEENTVLFENFNPVLMTQAVSVYDEAAGGKQTISIFIVPAVVMDGSLERLDPVEKTIGGSNVTLRRYLYGLPGVDVTLHLDSEGRFVFADVPQQHAAYVRDGYEYLLGAEEVTLVSQADYEYVLESGVEVPMRDGLKLSTDIYRPDSDGEFPVILVRTPYKKEMNELQAKFFARRGYVFAVQDCRGRFSSPGEWEPFVNEAADGYDTIEWLAIQPWSSGKVGMIGASYLGWVQWWAARDRPPHLVTIIPNVSPPDPYFNIPYEYGVFFLFGAIWWADMLETEATADISGKTALDVFDKKYAVILRDLPVVDLDRKVLGHENPYWRKWIAHPDNDEYWEPANFLDHLENLDIPVFHQSGWFDGDGIGSKLNYLKMASHGHSYQKLVLGPWGHTDQATRRIGGMDFGEEALVDLQNEFVRWLDHWLKGVDNGIEAEPLVSLFAMGSNKWLHGNTYPLEGTQMTKFFLSSGGNANTSNGDGVLGEVPPGEGVPYDRYVYDPGDPTPSPNYYLSADDIREIEKTDAQRRGETEAEEVGDGESVEARGVSELSDPPEADDTETSIDSVEELRERKRGFYAKVNAEREDILVYDTPVVEQPFTFAGPVSAVLYASSSAVDTDWFMRLAVVDKLGVVHGLVEGKVRARYRSSFKRPELLTPGEVYEYHLDLWQTGVTIREGERLRVEVASASFPFFSRNLNTGAHNETSSEYVEAEQRIYHDAEHPSHVTLPVIPE
jgi:putative CocE/NonD family hydrolase